MSKNPPDERHREVLSVRVPMRVRKMIERAARKEKKSITKIVIGAVESKYEPQTERKGRIRITKGATMTPEELKTIISAIRA